MSELAFRTASELCELLRRGELKSRDLLELQLERVAKHDPRINAVVTLAAARARAQADAADRSFAQGRVLGPGDAFEYTSACPLSTPFGSMAGTYQMVTDKGERFDAQIAAFQLAEPYAIN